MDEETDFHPDEEPVKEFTYSAYFQNLRHTLNIMMKKPVKKQLSSRCEKILIQVYKPGMGANTHGEQLPFESVEKLGRSYAKKAKVLNLDAVQWEESDYLIEEFNAMTSNKSIGRRPNFRAKEKNGLVKFNKQQVS